MDAAGIDVQVLSLNSPSVEQLEPAEAVAVARKTNDFFAEAVKRHPSRIFRDQFRTDLKQILPKRGCV